MKEWEMTLISPTSPTAIGIRSSRSAIMALLATRHVED